MQQQQFSSLPQAAPTKKKVYRDDEEPEKFNIMTDPRVMRGSAFVAKNGKNTKQQATVRTKTVSMRKKIAETRVGTPPPVDGRVHMVLQTDDFLEELSDKLPCADATTQTQASLDRPPSPLFVRTKIGKDIDTQIDDGDLFDFDMEVAPLLEVLVGKSLHVAMLEVMQEEELDAIIRQQIEYERLRNVELVEVQRLEAEERRKLQEKERRLEQDRQRQQERLALENKIAAQQFAHQYLMNLHTEVFDQLQEQGHFADPTIKEIEENFLDELVNNELANAEKRVAATNLLNEMLSLAMKQAKKITTDEFKRRKAASEPQPELPPLPDIEGGPEAGSEPYDAQ